MKVRINIKTAIINLRAHLGVIIVLILFELWQILMAISDGTPVNQLLIIQSKAFNGQSNWTVLFGGLGFASFYIIFLCLLDWIIREQQKVIVSTKALEKRQQELDKEYRELVAKSRRLDNTLLKLPKLIRLAKEMKETSRPNGN